MSLIRHQQKAEIITSLHGEGKTTKEIANEMGDREQNINYYLKILELKPHTKIKSLKLISKKEAQCGRCNEIKSIKQFQFGRRSKRYEYKFAYCNTCRRQQVYANLNDNVDSFLADRYRRIKTRAKSAGINFNITKEQFITQYHNQKGLCFYTDIKLACRVGDGWADLNALSVDKLIPDNGYVLGNVVFASNRINTCKNNLILDEIKQWMPSWYERIVNFISNHK